jgi:hypothetical protein
LHQKLCLLLLLLAWVCVGVCMVIMQLGIIISLMLRSTQRQRWWCSSQRGKKSWKWADFLQPSFFFFLTWSFSLWSLHWITLWYKTFLPFCVSVSLFLHWLDIAK